MDKPHHPGPDPASRSRFIDRDSYYVQAQPSYPPHAFVDERRIAFDPASPTGFVALDHREALGTGWPATTPAMLARYARIRRGESLESRFRASGEIYYVIAGAGSSRNGEHTSVQWRAGDVVCFDGGERTLHLAGDDDCLLWAVTDEPLLSFLGVAAAPGHRRVAGPLHFSAAAIAEALAAALRREQAKGTASNGNAAFIFSS
ncbi:MAG TPA: hypothetical protein VGP22_16540, partial [Albitalea sp.]|nr:hypothetical protein [Albitalea sp.]